MSAIRAAQLSLFRAEPTLLDAPLCVSYGMGVDSTAMLVGLWQRGIRPTLITFADTGGEKPETYAYLPVINAWLASVGFPEVVVVRYAGKHGRYKPDELTVLVREHPDLADRIVQMETAALPKMRTKTNGLWREGVKGTRGGIARPGRMTEWIDAMSIGQPWRDSP